jgi:LPLT family lysophospholipid transporter-like MFS transporter
VAFALMLVLGACGGFYVVPLNALLQKRGHETVGAGNAIALQNLADNAFMLVMTGLYTVVAHAQVGVRVTAIVFGVGLSATIGALWWHRARVG